MKKIRLIVACAGALSLQTSLATDWYLNRNENSSSYNCWYNAMYWRMRGVTSITDGTDGAALSAEDAYSVIWGYYLRAKASSAHPDYAEFTGKRLTIESGYLLQYFAGGKPTYFRNEGLFLRQGCWYYYAGTSGRHVVVEGSVTVEKESTAGSPFALASPVTDTSFTFNGPMRSPEEAVLQIGVGRDFEKKEIGQTGFSVTLAGDCSGYFGTLSVTSLVENTSETYGTTLRIPASDLAGTVAMSRGTRLVVTEDSQGLTVGSLALSGRGEVCFEGLHTVEVTNSLAVADGAVKLTMAVTEDCVPPALSTNRIELLKYPASSSVGVADFRPVVTGDCAAVASFSGLETSDEDGVRTLSAVFIPVVTQTVNDKADNNYQGESASSLYTHDPAHWSDGLNVHSGVAYLVTKIDGAATTLLTPGGLTKNYEFPGESLTIDTGCSLRHFNRSLHVKRLVFRNESNLYVGNGAGGIVTGGVVCAESGKATFSAYTGCSMKIDSELQGRARIWFGRIGGTGSPQALNEFTGMNTNFFGTFYVGQNVDPDLKYKFQTLFVSDERNLGGRLDEFNYKALHLERMSRLRTRKSFTLTQDMNRGVYVNNLARFYADEGMRMGMNAVLTMNGKLRKEGAGTLSMGGVVKFLDESTVPADTPRANSNLLEVVEGTLEVASANAVDGLEIAFLPGTGISLRVDPGNGALATYGIVNVKTDTPFSLDASFNGRLPVSVVFEDDVVPEIGDEYALMTVSSAAADEVEAMLPKMFWTPVKGLAAEVFRKEPADDGSVTFAVRFRRYGFRFLVR